MIHQAVMLVEVLPRTLQALAAGTLDMARVRVLMDATLNLSVEAVREVEDAALVEAGAGPWEGPTFQAFKARVRRAVQRVQTATVEQDAASVAEQTRVGVELDRHQAGLAMLKVCGPDAGHRVVGPDPGGPGRGTPERGSARGARQRRSP